MMRLFIAVLVSAVFYLSADAKGFVMKDFFKQMPDSVVPYLTENNRLDLIDFVESGMDSQVENKLGGVTRLLRLTDNYLKLRLTDASLLEMKLLQYGSGNADSLELVACAVMTYGDSIKESTVRFYSSDWEPVRVASPLSYETISRCGVSDSLPQGLLRGALQNVFVEAALSPDDENMTITLSYPDYGEVGKEKPSLRKLSTILKWSGLSFK